MTDQPKTNDNVDEFIDSMSNYQRNTLAKFPANHIFGELAILDELKTLAIQLVPSLSSAYAIGMISEAWSRLQETPKRKER